jgi:aspartyl-tRNA(Asn)/glutamyl-tRNA(Gln) amidotransferase subunit B
VSDAEMEKGTMRADVNVSVRKPGEEGYRPRWELKNMNSFTFIGRGIEAAVREQIAAYERGETIEQSTYDYDPDTDRLTVHRSKEEADDYRYFPEPDLVPVEPPAELVERLRGQVPERPVDRIRRFAEELGFAAAAELVMTGNEAKAEALAGAGLAWKDAAAIAMNRGDFLLENAAALAEIAQTNVTRKALDEAFAAAAEGPIEAEDYLARAAVGDESELAPVVDAVIAANPEQVETYRGGKEGVLGFLVGQVMKETQGKADPRVVNRLLQAKLRG